ncbi:hypothetical protein, partial [Pseudomonas aeruginosa]|uniref:hypothetical protein n=1 Tax=Pseudomonas aeruginosa TaxID=287 RepID=UPI0021DA34C4
LARALYKKPRILFLDEATSHLDVHCEQRVNAAIRALRLSGELEAQPDTGFVKAIDEMLAEARREHPALLAA